MLTQYQKSCRMPSPSPLPLFPRMLETILAVQFACGHAAASIITKDEGRGSPDEMRMRTCMRISAALRWILIELQLHLQQLHRLFPCIPLHTPYSFFYMRVCVCYLMSRIFGYFVLAFAFIVLSKFAHFAHSTCCILYLFCGPASSVLSSSRSLFSLLTLLPCRSNQVSDCRCLLSANRITCAKGMQHFGCLQVVLSSFSYLSPFDLFADPVFSLWGGWRERAREGRGSRPCCPTARPGKGPLSPCSASALLLPLLLSIIPRLHVTHAYVAAYFSFLRLSLRIFHRVLSSKGERGNAGWAGGLRRKGFSDWRACLGSCRIAL